MKGHFVATVSAAGLLTMPGHAPYAVTKHAALAFAEWLSMTYGDQGIRVQALCPQGVRTPMLDASGELGGASSSPARSTPPTSPSSSCRRSTAGPSCSLPHPEVARYYAGRAADPDAWLAGMRRLIASP